MRLVCDVRVSAASAWFDWRFPVIGLHPGGGNRRMLQELVGPQTAAAGAPCRRRLDAAQTEAAGPVLDVVADDHEVSTGAREDRAEGGSPRCEPGGSSPP